MKRLNSLSLQMKCLLATALLLALLEVGTTSVNAAKKRKPAAPQIPSDALPGLTAEQIAAFLQAKLAFNAPEIAPQGLGPAFNGRSCNECHPSGKGSSRISHFIGVGSAAAIQAGGPVIQLKSIPGTPAEKVPNHIPVSFRRAMTCEGLGFVGAIPDALLTEEQAWQRTYFPAIAGKANVVTDAVTSASRIGRIGQKSQHPNSTSFAAEAYLREMGVTSPFFPKEEAAYNNPINLILNPRPDVNTDGAAIRNFGIYMDLLPAPRRALPTNKKALAEVQNGESLFINIGCAVCHKRIWATGPHIISALHQVQFNPYSDFLLHDMGANGDGVQQGTDTNGQPIPASYMRTTPLWGARLNPVMWHDGRVKKGDFTHAINLHEGQGLDAKNQFLALPEAHKNYVLQFLNSL